MHEADIIHGDLKPDNVRVYDDGHVCILDVESAIMDWRTVDAADRARVTHTHGYAAPEVEEGVDCTPASDVFSLGVMLTDAVSTIKWLNVCSIFVVNERHVYTCVLTPWPGCP